MFETEGIKEDDDGAILSLYKIGSYLLNGMGFPEMRRE